MWLFPSQNKASNGGILAESVDVEVKNSAAIFRLVRDETRIENGKLVNTRDGKHTDGNCWSTHFFKRKTVGIKNKETCIVFWEKDLQMNVLREV